MSLLAQNAQEFQEQQNKSFNTYKKTQEENFKAYQDSQSKAFEEYKKELGVYWEKPKLSTKRTWISYTEDKKTRTNVDFSKNTIILETIANSPKQAKENLQVALAKAVTIDTKTLQDTDPLEKKLAKITIPDGVADAKVNAEPILSTVVFKKMPTKKLVYNYVNKNILNKNIKEKESKKVKYHKIYSIKVDLPNDTMLKRSKLYKDEIFKHARIQKLPASLVFAIMHSESSYNPRARSHIPAFGLMQIVPKTAGIDSYKYLYKKKRLVTGRYLYNSTNNITMGTAYLHILYYRYLKAIKNPESRLYCAIAAYNTGAGNIAWAFTRTYNMKKAAPLINKLTPSQVYAKLLKDLRWDEPKHYLKKVSKRMSAYNRVYGN